MGNNRYGNCVIATAGHSLLTWRANELQDFRRLTDAAVIELSRKMGALNGYNILDRLKYWRKNGMWGNKIWAYALIDPADEREVKQTIEIFGCADIGVNLPRAWKGKDVWDDGTGKDYTPNSWGPHSVPFVGYDELGAYCASWGEVFLMTWPAVARYCDEGYAIIDPDWIAGDDHHCPSGYDLALLRSDLDAISN